MRKGLKEEITKKSSISAQNENYYSNKKVYNQIKIIQVYPFECYFYLYRNQIK